MKTLAAFIFLAILYWYSFHSNDISFLHKPIVSILLYIIAIIACALMIVNVRKERISYSENND